MRISDVLQSKGSDVATIPPGASIRSVIAALAQHRVGALVVSGDGSTIAGIISERDVVRALHARGPDILDAPVNSLMTAEVHTAGLSDTIDQLTVLMTMHRVRHVPVVDGAERRLVGIVSIGDVVKSRIGELEDERAALVDYLTHGR